MKNITITVNDDLYRHARICAVHRDTTVTEVVRAFIMGLETIPGRRARAIKAVPAEDQNALEAQEKCAYLTGKTWVS